MKLGFSISLIDREPGHERNVPAHIQIPLHTMGLLAKRGHEVHLITNAPKPGRVLPACMPENVSVHYVEDSRRRTGVLEGKRGPHESTGVHPIKAIRQFRQIRAIVRDERFQILHLHGYEHAIYFAGLLRRTALPCPVVVTHYRPPAPANFFMRRLCRSINASVTSTRYVAEHWGRLGPKPRIIPHGPARDLLSELGGDPARERHRVLFWRDPSHRNGADICLAVFDRLAPLFPLVSFDLAVRPNPKEIPGLDELAARHANVHIHRLPYPPGISLPRLMAESICTLLPFRSLTTNPQLAIAESLAAGVAVVTTNIESNPEIIEDGRTGVLIPPDDADAAIAAVKRLLDDPASARHIGDAAAAHARRMWDWDAAVDTLLALYRELCR